MSNPKRRDFLSLAAYVTGGLGVGAIAWPFIDQMRPDGATEAFDSVEVDLSSIEEGMSVTIKWRGQPVIIRHRTKAEIARARATPLDVLKDRHARNANLAANTQATDDARCAGKGRENWLIMVNLCTHLGCVPRGTSGGSGGWFCPCHASVYDTAGRVRAGPASQNMAIPPYEFISDTLIRIG